MPRLLFLLILICPVLSLMTASRPAHDFHASVTQMQYNPKDKAFEISVRVFTDDFEKVLSQESGTKIHLSPAAINNASTSRPADKNDPLIEKYIRAHVAYVNAHKQTVLFSYVGYETEADAHWIYLEMPYTESFPGGQMKQNVMMEMFDDQVNMVNISYQGQKKTFVFRKNQPVQDVSF